LRGDPNRSLEAVLAKNRSSDPSSRRRERAARRSATSFETLDCCLTDDEMDKERSSGPDMNGRPDGGPEMVDAEPDVSEKRPDVNWTGPDMDSLGGAGWSGAAAKDRELSKVHAVVGGHVSSLNRWNDGIDADVARLALMAAPDREKNDGSDDIAAAVGGWSKPAPDGT
jgi:hypothetical protein